MRKLQPSRQCFVSGDFDGVAIEGRSQVVGIICRAVENLIQDSEKDDV